MWVTGSDAGFAVDSDGDRLIVVDEKGSVLEEAHTLAFSVWYVLGHFLRDGANVVTNLSTTRIIDDLVETLGGNLFKSPVGELKVAEAMWQKGAVIGGEGSCAGVMYNEISNGRDGLVAAALILSLMSSQRKTISELAASLPGYVSPGYIMLTGKTAFLGDDIAKELARIERAYGNLGQVNKEDGIRVDFGEDWFHVRKSNTEHIVRFIAESRNKETAEHIMRQLKTFFRASAS